MSEKKDHLVRRCPRLGGSVSFHYCRLGSEENRPCFKVLDCWWEAFDVTSHMRSCLPPDQFDVLLNRQVKPKLTSLVELIAQAKQRTGGRNTSDGG